MVERLLEEGADFNVRDDGGRRPIDIARGDRVRHILQSEDRKNRTFCEKVKNKLIFAWLVMLGVFLLPFTCLYAVIKAERLDQIVEIGLNTISATPKKRSFYAVVGGGVGGVMYPIVAILVAALVIGTSGTASFIFLFVLILIFLGFLQFIFVLAPVKGRFVKGYKGLSHPSNTVRCNGENVFEVLNLCLEIWLLFNFSLSGILIKPGTLPYWILRLPLFVVSPSLFLFAFTISLCLFLVWCIVASMVGTYLVIPNVPKLSETFPFIGKFFVADFVSRPFIRFLIEHLSSTLLPTVTVNLLAPSACTYQDGEWMHNVYGVKCFEGVLLSESIIGMVALLLYAPSTALLSALFTGQEKESMEMKGRRKSGGKGGALDEEKQEESGLDIQFPIFFGLLMSAMTFALSITDLFMSAIPIISLSIKTPIFVGIATMHLGYKKFFKVKKHAAPCCIRKVNYILATAYLCALWGCFCGFVAYFVGDPANTVAFILLFVGWLCLIVFFVVAYQRKIRQKGTKIGAMEEGDIATDWDSRPTLKFIELLSLVSGVTRKKALESWSASMSCLMPSAPSSTASLPVDGVTSGSVAGIADATVARTSFDGVRKAVGVLSTYLESNGTTLSIGLSDRRIRVYSVQYDVVADPKSRGKSVLSMLHELHSPNKPYAITTMDRGRIIVEGGNAARCIWKYQVDRSRPFFRQSTRDIISSTACSRTLAVFASAHELVCVRIADGTVVDTIGGWIDRITQVLFHRGKWYISSGRSVFVFDALVKAKVSSPSRIIQMCSEDAMISSFCVEKEVTVTAGLDDGRVSVCEIFNPKEIIFLPTLSLTGDQDEGHTKCVTSVRSTDDVILSSGEDRRILIWNRDSWACCNRLKVHDTPILRVFTRNRHVISVSLTEIIVWTFELAADIDHAK
jgi:hypothetical protein